MTVSIQWVCKMCSHSSCTHGAHPNDSEEGGSFREMVCQNMFPMPMNPILPPDLPVKHMTQMSSASCLASPAQFLRQGRHCSSSTLPPHRCWQGRTCVNQFTFRRNRNMSKWMRLQSHRKICYYTGKLQCSPYLFTG